MKQVFRPYINHTVTAWRSGRGGFAVWMWHGDDQWPASLQLTHRWRGTIYWHIWFFGLMRYKQASADERE